METTKKRNSNFELLRIIAMFLIILDHANRHGFHFEDSNFNSIILLSFFNHLGPIGNWLFFLISGYYLTENNFAWKKVFKLWFQVFSVSIIIGVIVFITKIPIIKYGTEALNSYEQFGFISTAAPASVKEIIVSFMPCYFSTSWYASAYLVFFMLMPFLDIFLKTLSQDKHKNLIVLLSVLGTIITVFPSERFFIPSEIYPFILAFFIAKYIKIYQPKWLMSIRRNNIVIFLGCFLLVIYKIGIFVFLRKFGFSEKYIYNIVSIFDKNTSFLIMIISISIFCNFLNFKPFYSKIINVIASSTFGIFLIHANILIKYWIWHKVWKFDNYVNSSFKTLFSHYILCVIITYIICCTLELGRKIIIEKPFFKLFSVIEKKKKA